MDCGSGSLGRRNDGGSGLGGFGSLHGSDGGVVGLPGEVHGLDWVVVEAHQSECGLVVGFGPLGRDSGGGCRGVLGHGRLDRSSLGRSAGSHARSRGCRSCRIGCSSGGKVAPHLVVVGWVIDGVTDGNGLDEELDWRHAAKCT